MAKARRSDLSRPFLVLGLVLGVGVAVATGRHESPTVAQLETLAFGWLLVAFTLTYSYRPLRESVYGQLVSSLFIMLFATFFYLRGSRGPLLPFGLFALALAAFCYQLYRLGSDGRRRSQIS
ncbi:hypothetical protein [Halorientalis halophila]|uniref:hypothetical protein n=1 Tax=Halorientalis halophila TaxID=3108499 RepID=UPI00300B1B7D